MSADFERYCQREERDCSPCGNRGMHVRVKVSRLVQWARREAMGWQCEGCGSVTTDVAAEQKAGKSKAAS